jgi:dTDP-4-amino-4,6-dideoxygalactose transaminase
VPFVGLTRQHARIEQDLKDAFARLLETSAFTLGPEVERFEAAFAEYCGAAECIGVASGTAALSLTLQAAGIGPGDEVIVPGHTFIASALGIAHVGATPVLCDVDDATGLIDPDAARAAVTERTAAIVPVHLYGQMCDMDAINALAAPKGIFVLEDAAQAHGARYRDGRAGSIGSAGAFSFYPSKNLGALGDGGAVCTSDPELAAGIRRLRHLGQRAKGEHVELGYNERLDGLQAALLSAKLPHLDGWNDARRAHAGRYAELLPEAVKLLGERPESPCTYHLFPVRVADRDALAAGLGERRIQTGVHYSPAIAGHPAWSHASAPPVHGELPNSDAWAAQELSLPMFPELEPGEIERVADAVREILS